MNRVDRRALAGAAKADVADARRAPERDDLATRARSDREARRRCSMRVRATGAVELAARLPAFSGDCRRTRKMPCFSEKTKHPPGGRVVRRIAAAESNDTRLTPNGRDAPWHTRRDVGDGGREARHDGARHARQTGDAAAPSPARRGVDANDDTRIRRGAGARRPMNKRRNSEKSF
jgi:hypothetical protein